MKNQFGIKNLKNSMSFREADPKNFVDDLFNDASLMKNAAHVDFSEENFDIVTLVRVNSLAAVRELLAPKFNVGNAISNSIDESSLLR